MKGALRMLLVLAALAAGRGSSALRAQAAGSANPDIPDMRHLMRAEYHYLPDRAAAAAQAVATGAVPAVPAAPAGVVQLPTVFVPEKRSHDAELTQALSDQKAAAQQAALMRKLGVGVIGTTVGRHFAAGVVTVFYLPVFVGAGFSW